MRIIDANQAERVPAGDETQWAVLAGLRFALAVIVMCHHLEGYVLPHDPVCLPGIGGGLAAVIAFFVISGYSMAHSLSRDPDQLAFYKRRLWRIYPCYAVALGLAAFLLPAIALLLGAPGLETVEGPNAAGLGLTAVFLQGMLCHELPRNGVVWSLSVEVWLYIAAPYLQRATVSLLRWLAALSMTICLYHLYTNGDRFYHTIHGIALLCLAWAFIGGFSLYRFGKEFGNLSLYWIAAVGMTAGCALVWGEPYSPITVAISLLVIANARRIPVPPHWTKRLLWLGDMSYPLYLVHVPVMYAAQEVQCTTGWIIVLWCLAGAAAVLHGIDLPARRLAKRLEARAKVALPSGSAGVPPDSGGKGWEGARAAG